MNIFKWVESKIKELHWYDVTFIKISTAASVLWAAKVFPVLVSYKWYVYFLIIVVASIRPLYVMFREKKRKKSKK